MDLKGECHDLTIMTAKYLMGIRFCPIRIFFQVKSWLNACLVHTVKYQAKALQYLPNRGFCYTLSTLGETLIF